MSSKAWKKEEVEKVKMRIRDEVLAIQDANQRLPYLIERIGSSAGQDLDQVIYIHTALHSHLRVGGLDDTQIKELVKLSSSLLTLHNIRRKGSSVAFLLGELHALQAQLHMLSGSFLLACIEQQLMHYVAGSSISGGEAFHNLALAQFVLHMGDSKLCLNYVERCLEQSSDFELRHRAEILKLRVLRLSIDYDAAEDWSKRISSTSSDQRWTREIAWEELCRKVFQDGKIDSLILKLNTRHDFYYPGYLLEGIFWTRADPNPQWLDYLPKLKSLNQKKDMNFKAYPAFYRCSQYLERIYDKEVPFGLRLASTSKIMQSIQNLPDVDKVLLATLCVVRWLLRNQCKDLARAIFSEYRNLSLRLSEGKSKDVLGIAHDIQEKLRV